MRAMRVSVAEQHLEALGAAFKVCAVNLRVAAWARLAPRRLVLVAFHVFRRTRLVASCGLLLHGSEASLGIESLH
jgi:hypothetical protein